MLNMKYPFALIFWFSLFNIDNLDSSVSFEVEIVSLKKINIHL